MRIEYWIMLIVLENILCYVIYKKVCDRMDRKREKEREEFNKEIKKIIQKYPYNHCTKKVMEHLFLM